MSKKECPKELFEPAKELSKEFHESMTQYLMSVEVNKDGKSVEMPFNETPHAVFEKTIDLLYFYIARVWKLEN